MRKIYDLKMIVFTCVMELELIGLEGQNVLH